jgi:hypothetical protein
MENQLFNNQTGEISAKLDNLYKSAGILVVIELVVVILVASYSFFTIQSPIANEMKAGLDKIKIETDKALDMEFPVFIRHRGDGVSMAIEGTDASSQFRAKGYVWIDPIGEYAVTSVDELSDNEISFFFMNKLRKVEDENGYIPIYEINENFGSDYFLYRTEYGGEYPVQEFESNSIGWKVVSSEASMIAYGKKGDLYLMAKQENTAPRYQAQAIDVIKSIK